MLVDTVLWGAVFVVLAGLGIAFAVPSTRTYARKYWWVAVAGVVVVVGAVVLRRRPGRDVSDSQAEGEKIKAETSGLIDSIVDHAKTKQAAIDAELAMGKLENSAARERAQSRIDDAQKIGDSLERRRALIRISEDFKA